MPGEEVMIDTPLGIRAYLNGGAGLPGIRVIRSSTGGEKMAVVSEGRIRSGDDVGQERAIALDADNAQFVVQAGTPYAELTRLGGGYSAIATAAVAALVVRPSTVAMFTLWNGETAGGKSYVIDRLFTHNLVSTNALSFFGIWACVHPAGMTNPGEDIAASASNVTGNSGKGYNGQAVVGVEETVVNNGWYPWTNSVEVTTATILPGAHLVAEVAGRLIVPPQGGISLQIVCSLATQTFTTGLSWYEVQLKLE